MINIKEIEREGTIKVLNARIRAELNQAKTWIDLATTNQFNANIEAVRGCVDRAEEYHNELLKYNAKYETNI